MLMDAPLPSQISFVLLGSYESLASKFGGSPKVSAQHPLPQHLPNCLFPADSFLTLNFGFQDNKRVGRPCEYSGACAVVQGP